MSNDIASRGWACKQIPNGQNPIVVCERGQLNDEVARLRAEVATLARRLQRRREHGREWQERLQRKLAKYRHNAASEQAYVESLRAEVPDLAGQVKLLQRLGPPSQTTMADEIDLLRAINDRLRAEVERLTADLAGCVVANKALGRRVNELDPEEGPR